jgi:noranthrone synthase
MESVLSVFAPTESSRPRDRPLHVGSAKANIGHGEGVSGVTSLIKVLLMMKHDTIVPHCGIKPGSKINHNYPDLGARNVHIAFEPKPWARKQQPRRVLINNFSAAGGNTALLLEDAPALADPIEVDPRGSHVVTASAVVGKSLKNNLESLLQFITKEEARGLSLPQLSWTTTARRWHHLHRVGVVGSSISEIKTKLQHAIAAGEGMTRSKTKPNLLMAFTGQGSQYLGMGKQLYDLYPRFREDLNGFNQLAQNLGFPPFLPVILQTQGEMEDYRPVEAQLAITCLQMALAAYLKAVGVTPGAVVGHSLGEYAALNVAGVLSASDTIYLVGKRAELLQTRCQRGTHAMLAVKASRAVLFELLANKKYEIACINGPEDTVLSGTNEQIGAAYRIVAAANLKSTQLKLPFAFHSAQVQPVLEDLETLAQNVVFHKPTIPVLSPLLGIVVDDSGIFSPAYIARHCRETVNMEKVLLQAKGSQLITDKTISVEVGPQPLVSGMIKTTLGSNMTTVPTLQRNKDTFANLSTAITILYNKGYEINWVAYHEPFKGAHKVIELPSYKWDLKEYFIPYEGDWCLHRHKIDCACADLPGSEHKHATDKACIGAQDSPKAPQVTLESTTCVHTIVEETTAPLGATLIVETDCSRADTNHVVQGHQVNHIALCTPSVYADIAFTVGKYTMDKLRSSHTGAIDGVVDVSDLVVEKALIPHGQGPQILRTTLTIAWPPKAAASARSAKVEFCSMKPNGQVDTKHAWCTVRFVNKSQLHALEKSLPEYQAKVRRLREGTKIGEFVKYNRTAGYKLMSNVAHFHPDYKLLDNLVLDETTLEACSQLSFDRIQAGGKFYAHPAAVDAITQVGGFAMNAKDSTDLDVDVYVNHGWESFQIYEPLSKGIIYETYVQMHPDKRGNLCHGDTIVMNGDKVVAFFKGLSLRNVPRKALRMVLQQSFDKGARQNGKPTAGSVDLSVGPAPKAVKTVAERAHAPLKTDPIVAHPISAPAAADSAAPEPALVKASVTLATETAATVQSDSATVIAAINIVAEESGIALEELTDDSNFSEAGIDSLGSMVISSRFREELGLDLDSQFSIFTDLPTVRDLKNFLGGRPSAAEPQTAISASAQPRGGSSPEDSTSASDADASDVETENSSESEPEDLPVKLYPYCIPASSVILQGIPKVAEKILFMLPDGGGSASSYAPIPRLRADVALIGLNCPYARDPENMNCTHTAMIDSFCNEIRRRQPKGPYHLGGWSSGGAFAYVTAEALVNQGEEVHSLIIIDAPVPQVMEKLPVSFYEYCNTVGLFANQPGGSSNDAPPPYLVPHFVAVVDVMMDYKVAPLKTDRMPKVGIVWASETVMDEKSAPKMKGMHFMIQKRTDFGPDGWDEVMPGAEFDIVKADGANHFSLMVSFPLLLTSAHEWTTY